MKYFLFILYFSFSSLLFADAGNAYRFNLELISKKGDTLNGYFYHYSYEDFNESNYSDNRFKKFTGKEDIVIYTYIASVKLRKLVLDFTTDDYKKNINLNDFYKIRINDYLKFRVAYKLIKLTKEEFGIIEIGIPKTIFFHNEKVSENCSYILFTWESEFDFSEHKEEISAKLIWLSEDIVKNHKEFYNYLFIKKERLLKKRAILINHCEAL